MTKEQQNTYTELVRVAALQIPFKLDETTTASLADFGVETEDGQGHGTLAPFLQLCTMYNLYVESIDQSKQLWKLVFPEIVLDVLDIDDPRLPFWKSFLKIAPWISASGTILETITQRSFLLRLAEALDCRSEHTLGELLPFLKTSLCANTKIVQLDAIVPVPFPKLVFSKNHAKPIDTLDAEDKEKQLTHIKSFFHNPKNFITVNILDWKYLHTQMKPGVLYIPGGNDGKSASSDILYISEDANSRVRLDMQCKDGTQEITTQMLAEEGWKTALGKAKGESLTLLIAGFKMATTVLQHPQGTRIKQGTDDLAVHFAAGAAFGFPDSASLKAAKAEIGEIPRREFIIPDRMDIVLLLRAGMDLVLTKQNADVLANETAMTNFDKLAPSIMVHM